jgi:hypothetical protein
VIGAVHPYSAADTVEAAHWLSYIATVREAVCSNPYAGVAEVDAATVEAIDKLQRRGVISFAAAALLGEIFDIPADHAFA